MHYLPAMTRHNIYTTAYRIVLLTDAMLLHVFVKLAFSRLKGKTFSTMIGYNYQPLPA